MDWSYNYGNVTQNEISAAWDAACIAVEKYGSYLNAVLQTQQQLAALEASSSSSSSSMTIGSGSTGTPPVATTPNVVGNSGKYDTSGGQETEAIHNIITQMYNNGQAWHSANDSEKKRLDAENLRLGQSLSRYGISPYRDNGTWYDSDGALFFNKYKRYIYHTGGIVGDEPTLKQKELFIKAEEGEAVLTKKQQDGLYRLIDKQETMLAKYGSIVGAVSGTDLMAAKMQTQIQKDAQQAQGIANNSSVTNEFNITLPVHTLQKLDDSEIHKLTDKISKYTINELDEAFGLRGKRSFRR